jgi:hypothetical protein
MFVGQALGHCAANARDQGVGRAQINASGQAVPVGRSALSGFSDLKQSHGDLWLEREKKDN